MNRFKAALTLVLLGILVPSGVMAKTWHVDCNSDAVIKDGSSWFRAFHTIGAAVVLASDGDTILVASYEGWCTYNESLTLNKRLYLYGGYAGWLEEEQGGDGYWRDILLHCTKVYGGLSGNCFTINSGGNGSVIDGFWIYGGRDGIECNSGVGLTTRINQNRIYDNDQRGIHCNDASPTITGNEICDNGNLGLLFYGGGICCEAGSDPDILNNNEDGIFGDGIHDNRAKWAGGICCYSSSPTIENNSIHHNQAKEDGGGIACYQDCEAEITGNRIRYNIADATGLTNWGGGGISIAECPSPSLEVRDNEIYYNEARWGAGISCIWNSAPIVEGNSVRYNTAQADGGGMTWYQSCGQITGNTICDNTSSWAGGLNIQDCPPGCPTVSGNLICRNHATEGVLPGDGGGIVVHGSSPSITENEITENECSKRGGGIFIEAGSEPYVANNTISGNLASLVNVFAGGGGVCFGDSAPTLENNEISGNQAGWAGGVCCWSSSGTISSNSIHDNEAAQGGGGVGCSETSVVHIAGNTVEYNTSRWGGGIYVNGCQSPALQISGNTILGNEATESAVFYGDGGGICCYKASPTITGNEITQNQCKGRGGGISIEDDSEPYVADNTITNNTAGLGGVYQGGGGVRIYKAGPALQNNLISGNDAGWGGGVYCQDDEPGLTPTLIGNTISGNDTSGAGNNATNGDGGGLCVAASSPDVDSNEITWNAAGKNGGGISIELGSEISLVNNVFKWNTASGSGGAIRVTGSDPDCLANNTILYNTAVEKGGGVFCENLSYPCLCNDIVCWNEAADGGGIYNSPFCSPVLKCNDFYGNSPNDYSGIDDPGIGNISKDPLLVDPEQCDVHLDGCSPCVDAGYPCPTLPGHDFESDDRVIDGDRDTVAEVDIGADEYVPTCVETSAPTYGDPPLQDGTLEGPLFGQPQGGYPGWAWFSIPLDPDECCDGGDCYDPAKLLGFDCSGKLWRWDKYGKFLQVWRPPFSDWDLGVGNSYILYLTDPVGNPSYFGMHPGPGFKFKLGRMGWTWVGKPCIRALLGGGVESDFMTQVKVQYPVGGETRTAAQDWEDETPWIQWGWLFYDTYRQAPKAFTPYADFGHNDCYPWIGYRVWVNVGMADGPEYPDQVTLIWYDP